MIPDKTTPDSVSPNPLSSSQENLIPAEETLPFTPPETKEPSPSLPRSQPLQPLLVEEPIPQPILVEEQQERPEVEDRPPLVPVAGNPKVMRCLNCKTFVSANADHRYSDCDLRLARKASHKGTKSTAFSKTKRVDKNLVKSFRKLEKENAKTDQLKASISKKASALIKKYKTQSKKTTKIPKQLISFLDFITKRIH